MSCRLSSDCSERLCSQLVLRTRVVGTDEPLRRSGGSSLPTESERTLSPTCALPVQTHPASMRNGHATAPEEARARGLGVGRDSGNNGGDALGLATSADLLPRRLAGATGRGCHSRFPRRHPAHLGRSRAGRVVRPGGRQRGHRDGSPVRARQRWQPSGQGHVRRVAESARVRRTADGLPRVRREPGQSERSGPGRRCERRSAGAGRARLPRDPHPLLRRVPGHRCGVGAAGGATTGGSDPAVPVHEPGRRRGAPLPVAAGARADP